MFHVSRAAAIQLANARTDKGLPDTTGVRVFGEPRPGGALALGLAFTEVPAEDDQVFVEGPTRVFVASEVSEPLADVTLDVEETPEGTQLVLTHSPDTGG